MVDIYRYPSKGKGFIYRYISPNNKSYVGQTTTSLVKRSGKRGKMYLGCKVFYNAIKKYGFENFKAEILGEFELNQLDKMEEYYIHEFNSLIPYGYNVKDGGQKTSRKENPIYAYNLNGAKPVKQIDPNTNEVTNIYDSASAAARALGLSRPSGISACCNGKHKLCAGYKWQFLQGSTTTDP